MEEFLKSHHYIIVSKISEGSVGTIYQVVGDIVFKIRRKDFHFHSILNEELVVKKLFPTNIPSLENSQFYAFAMPLGVSVKDIIDKVDNSIKKQWAINLCDDLEGIHNLNVSHNDINFFNIIIIDGKARFCDFDNSTKLCDLSKQKDINNLFRVLKNFVRLPHKTKLTIDKIRNLLSNYCL